MAWNLKSPITVVILTAILFVLLLGRDADAQFSFQGPPRCILANNDTDNQLSIAGDNSRTCGLREHGAQAQILDWVDVTDCADVASAVGGGVNTNLVQWSDSRGASGGWECVPTEEQAAGPDDAIQKSDAGGLAGIARGTTGQIMTENTVTGPEWTTGVDASPPGGGPGRVQFFADSSTFGGVAEGTLGQVLTQGGTGLPPVFQDAPGNDPGGAADTVQFNNAGTFDGITNGSVGDVLTSNVSGAPSFQTPSANVIGPVGATDTGVCTYNGASGQIIADGPGVAATSTLNAGDFTFGAGGASSDLTFQVTGTPPKLTATDNDLDIVSASLTANGTKIVFADDAGASLNDVLTHPGGGGEPTWEVQACIDSPGGAVDQVQVNNGSGGLNGIANGAEGLVLANNASGAPTFQAVTGGRTLIGSYEHNPTVSDNNPSVIFGSTTSPRLHTLYRFIDIEIERLYGTDETSGTFNLRFWDGGSETTTNWSMHQFGKNISQSVTGYPARMTDSSANLCALSQFTFGNEGVSGQITISLGDGFPRIFGLLNWTGIASRVCHAAVQGQTPSGGVAFISGIEIDFTAANIRGGYVNVWGRNK